MITPFRLQSYVPRTFGLSLPIASNDSSGSAVLGDVFTITTVHDIGGTNELEFVFTAGGAGAGQIPIVVEPNDRVPDIMQAIEAAISGTGLLTSPPIFGADATSLGGSSGSAANLSSFPLFPPDFNTGGFGPQSDRQQRPRFYGVVCLCREDCGTDDSERAAGC